jgi:hypothetical protein
VRGRNLAFFKIVQMVPGSRHGVCLPFGEVLVEEVQEDVDDAFFLF